VDNNSTDQTRKVVADFCRSFPGRFRYVLELQQGVSYARNAGVRESRGDVLAFVDDDVTVSPEWLWNLTAGLYSGEWAGAGGRILPQWTCSPPSWIPLQERHGLAPLAAFDLGVRAGPLIEPPFGANMAFRKEIFGRYGGFRTDLGRCADNLISNEDTEFGRRLLTAGEQLRYEPSAVIYHPVPENRLKRYYFLKFWFNKGRSDIMEFGVPNDARWYVAGVPVYLFRRLARWAGQGLLTLKTSKQFSTNLSLSIIAGQIFECYRMSRGASGKGSAFIERRRHTLPSQEV
jgi:glycosyltransferase involved in cell wall biosynthesis